METGREIRIWREKDLLAGRVVFHVERDHVRDLLTRGVVSRVSAGAAIGAVLPTLGGTCAPSNIEHNAVELYVGEGGKIVPVADAVEVEK